MAVDLENLRDVTVVAIDRETGPAAGATTAHLFVCDDVRERPAVNLKERTSVWKGRQN